MSTCRKCNGEIVWKKTPEGWRCTELNGEDHWDICTQRVRGALTPEEVQRMIARHPFILTKGKHREFYEVEPPPWDESLGDFQCFEGCCNESDGRVGALQESEVFGTESFDF